MSLSQLIPAAETEAKRTALILAAAQAIVGSAPSIAISMGGLAGHYLLGLDKSLATAPVTGFALGTALGMLPAAALMRRIGRRYGFMAGAGVTSLGGIVAALALFRGDFWLFVAGLLVIGLGSAFVQQYRFAATDNAPSSFKPKAVSWVLTGGVFAAIIGPTAVIYTRTLFEPVMFAGSFLAVGVIGVLGIGILSLLRLQSHVATAADDDDLPARPLGAIISQPRFFVALFCAIVSYALMSFVMTGAPLAMVGCGFSADEATLGIQWHVLAMFGPSFFTGRLISRFGKEAIVAAGLLLLLACAGVALAGIELWNFWLALILLGVGWNFGFIGATTMVTETYRRSEKGKIEGLHDFLLFGTVAIASLMSGKMLTAFGWDVLNWIVIPVSAACLLALAALGLHERRRVSLPAQ
ncbi:MFS transporter [Phyllobacterium leguminum]|uniref:Putative MFS family arabinose efflux permease n=1 Tax=Phyllobacterium leguminum TaxID=314237 RepID=A0A318T0H7_9HYPH|nr:MFS transporter [Phyllobacterium leguminum]PYE87174.1 putative MFS family arabinose efflux permease [Phyllobacterium leguminum]